MKIINNLIKMAKDFFSQYPAVLSGYVIYAYLFISIMHFYLKAKTIPLDFYDIFTIFSALPFMWFLSVALVKIIDVKTKLYDSERHRILTEKELEIQQTQLQTMQETVRGLQHHINNPLAVIMLSMEAARKAAPENKEVILPITMAEQSIDRIQVALSGFATAQQYKTEAIGSFCGKMVSLKAMIHAH
jgi:signal transduction histidine kinase